MSLKIVRRLIPDWGTTYGPPGDGPFPAVMIFQGSEGALSGWSHRNAVLLAAHGFLAFPYGYSRGGNAWNAGSIDNVPLDRGVEALAALRAFPATGGKVALYGVSRGAEHALLLASLMARDGLAGLPDAVAAHSPPTSSAAPSTRAAIATAATPAGNPGTRRTGPGPGAAPATTSCRQPPSKSNATPARSSSATAPPTGYGPST
ncbi:S9 family peptidase [Pleomorphomonas sp. NRK KF1]|uniref:alpha/beta hydrolase family protein n=1 Tax=Pleomorphomonas sp. NRK KF1 TaxID=2943000 RepID=UPI002044A84D|nr:hypothetical protein [Pleomorphomonas sp. NRK KF1]MCM5554164.1 hypothetical protein [Pleomorphomonas sp. NRK KF1]